MEESLPPILRKRGAVDADAIDGNSLNVLDDVHFMGLICWCVSGYYVLSKNDFIIVRQMHYLFLKDG